MSGLPWITKEDFESLLIRMASIEQEISIMKADLNLVVQVPSIEKDISIMKSVLTESCEGEDSEDADVVLESNEALLNK